MTLLFSLAAVLLTAPSNIRAAPVDDLKAGKVLEASVPSRGIWPGRAMCVINAPADKVFAVINDFAAYKEFVPKIVGSRQIGSDRFELTGMFPWPISETRLLLKVDRGNKGNARFIRWEMTSGTLREYQGIAWISPWGKQRTVLTYEMLAVPRIFAPTGLMTIGLRKATGLVIRAIRKRATEPNGVKTASR
jgi:ribosome-associated toxin RatA of RatAB toxin-antitoxin module